MLDRVRRPFVRYARWLHTRWPAGTVEKLPEVAPDGSTNVPGVYVAGDLTGIPLLKLSARSGVRAVRAILDDPAFRSARRHKGDGVLDLVIVGAGVAGMAAALEAREAGLDYRVFEAKRAFQTLADFPRGKPIYAYPTGMKPDGPLRFSAGVKEDLLAELQDQTRGIEVEDGCVDRVLRSGSVLQVSLQGGRTVPALRVIVAIGRSGNFRKLGVAGEHLDKVHNRLHDPMDYAGKRVLVVGGGDSALETAVALAGCGAEVTLSYRKSAFSRPKPANLEQVRALAENRETDVAVEHPVPERVTSAAGAFLGPGRGPGTLRLAMGSTVRRIEPERVVLAVGGDRQQTLANDVVFSMIGREAPLEFFRRSGIRISGEWTRAARLSLFGFLVFCAWLYHWKAPYAIPFGWTLPSWLDPSPEAPLRWLASAGAGLSAALADPSTLLGTLRISASSPGFYYTLAYSTVVVVFGIRRIRFRRTPYVRLQTWTLMAVQVVPLFLLPEIVLPWLGHNGAFDGGVLGAVADGLFPAAGYGHGREYWRAYGFILAWPLMVWNWFTREPLAGWLVIGAVQTFGIIPLLIRFYGKGAYCGWICSCGALAETLGDRHRHKMPHGPAWNRLNLLGQFILAAALVLMALRVAGWVLGPGSWASRAFEAAHTDIPLLNYNWLVDLMLAGVLGYGLYFWFSGRMWCRFACPLAALMHVYARFSRFRILAEKSKCISCNVCTKACHQGIDVMNFANKGVAMADPECVRCSACVQSCPTGVLTFGQVDSRGRVVATDALRASLVQIEEGGPRTG